MSPAQELFLVAVVLIVIFMIIYITSKMTFHTTDFTIKDFRKSCLKCRHMNLKDTHMLGTTQEINFCYTCYHVKSGQDLLVADLYETYRKAQDCKEFWEFSSKKGGKLNGN